MNNNPASFHKLLAFGLGDVHFQEFVDKFQLKYNKLDVSGFNWDPEIQLDYTYEQLVATLNIATLPIYVDADAEALDKANGKFEVGSNKIPTQKHRYPLNTRVLRQQMLFYQKMGNSYLTADTKNAIRDLLFDSTDKLIAGNRNSLTHQRMQVVSTGKFVIDTVNNPRGIKGIEFDFGVSDITSLTGDARWWTTSTHVLANEGSASDPILDLKNKVKARKRIGRPVGSIEMAESLFDDLLTHSKVLERIGYATYPTIATSANAQVVAAQMTDDARKGVIERLIGAPIVLRDSVAAVDYFDAEKGELAARTVENFKVTNIAFLPAGEIGTIKAVQPLIFEDDPTVKTAWFDGGRTLITERFNSKTRSMYVESEMATLCVPSVPHLMSVMTVTE